MNAAGPLCDSWADCIAPGTDAGDRVPRQDRHIDGGTHGVGSGRGLGRRPQQRWVLVEAEELYGELDGISRRT